MHQLANSAILQALGYAIIQTLWQFALAWLVYWVVNVFFSLTAKQKYLIAVSFHFAGFCWFVCTIFVYSVQPVTANSIPGFTIGNFFLQTFNIWLFEKEGLLPYLATIYLLILVFFILKWMSSYRQSLYLKTKKLEKINGEWRLLVDQLSLQMNIKNKVAIYLSGIVESPLTIGFWKPVILIPLATLNYLDTKQMEAVILHELAHIKRHDYFINLFISLSEVILFFNPFMHLLSSEIKKERENCCDDWVLQYSYNPSVYANALLAIAAPCSNASLALYASDKKLLLARIKRIIQPQIKPQYNFRCVLMACLTISLFASLILISTRHLPAVALTNIPQEMKNESQNPLLNDVIASQKNNEEMPAAHRKASIKIVENKRISQLKNSPSFNLQTKTIVDEKSKFQNDFANYLETIKSTKNEVEIIRLKEMLPKMMAQVDQQKNLLNQNDVITIKKQLKQAIEFLNQPNINSDNGSEQGSGFANVREIFAQPYEYRFASKNLVIKKQSDTTNLQTNKLIIIELPANLSDTLVRQILYNGKVLKITKI